MAKIGAESQLEINSMLVRIIGVVSLMYLLMFADTLAQTISWSNAVFDDLFTSDGTPMGSATATYNFELGTFGPGYTPDGTNVSAWATTWKPFDRQQLNATSSFFSSSATRLVDGTSNSTKLTAPSDTFAVGEQAYIWAFDGSDPATASEWALFTNTDATAGWTMPATSANPPLQWTLSGADTVVFGGINDTTSDLGTRTSSPSPFDLQTHATGVVVPEPSSAMLVLLGVCGWIMSRRR